MLLMASCGKMASTGLQPNADIQPYSVAGLKAGDFSRLRVTIYGAAGAFMGKSSSLQVCVTSGCVDLPATPAAPYLSETYQYRQVVDALVPAGVIQSIQVKTESGGIQVATQLDLPRGTRTDVMVRGDQPSLDTTFVARTNFSAERPFLVHPEGDAIALSEQVHLQIPAGAVKKTTLTSANLFDRGEEFPLIDFYPNVALARSATLKLTKLRTLNTNTAYQAFLKTTSTVSSQSLEGQLLRLNVEPDNNGAMIDLPSLSIITMSEKNPIVVLEDGSRLPLNDFNLNSSSIQQQATTQCGQNLANNLSAYVNILNSQGSLRITECENIFPYVNIVVVKMNHSQSNTVSGASTTYQPVIARNVKFYQPDDYLYGLDSIRDLSASVSAFTAINGYTWKLDLLFGNIGYRIQEGNDAEPTTTVMNKGVIEHTNENDGKDEAIISFSNNTSGFFAGNYVFHSFGTPIPSSAYRQAAIGSGSTVTVNSTCNPGATDQDMRSAIGFGNNRLVLVSSTHRGTGIMRSDLCEVFQGLNANSGSVLMDGSSAAGLTYGANGHLNPVPNTGSFEDGMRQIAYAFAVTKKSYYRDPR